MTNDPKRRRLESTLSTDPDDLSVVLANIMKEVRALDEHHAKRTIPDIQYNTVSDLYSKLIGDPNNIKRYANEILQHERSTINLYPDGRILITPYARRFPSAVIGHILSFCDARTVRKCALVNQAFHTAATAIMYRSLDFRGPHHDSLFQCLFSSPQKARLVSAIRELHLDGRQWTDLLLLQLLPHLDLHHLTIMPGTNITDACYQQLIRRSPHLTSLELQSADLSPAFFKTLGHCGLVDLVWHAFEQQSDWVGLLTGCPLERLRVITYVGNLNPSAMSILQTFDKLTSLTVDQITATPTPFTQLLATTWPALTHLSLGPCLDLDDTTLINFIATHPHLSHIELKRAAKLTDKAIDAIATLPLTDLTLTGADHLSATSILALIKSTQLTTLSLVSCPHIATHLVPTSNPNDLTLTQPLLDNIRNVD